MPQTDLHNAVKQAVADLGVEIVKSPTFASVLLDYHAYPKDPVLSSKQKNVMKAILENGYGEKVYGWFSNRSLDWKRENDLFIADFLRKTAYDAKVVDTVSQALLFGIALIDEVTVSWRDIEVEDNQATLTKLKDAYLQILIKSIKVEEDRSGIRVACISHESLAELMQLEESIKRACSTQSVPYQNWCKNKKAECLKKANEDLISHNEMVGKNLQKRKKRKWIIIILSIIFAPLAFILSLVPLLVVIDLFDGTDDTEKSACEIAIAQGDSLAALHQRDAALLAYQSAIDNYEGTRKKSHFQKIVTQKRNELLLKEYADFSRSCTAAMADSLPTASKCLWVKMQIDSLPSDSLLTEEEIAVKKERVAPVKKELNQRIANKTKYLLNSVSANSGKIDASTQKQLDTLLLCSPDDYWLNIIKKKMK